jgi:molybdenum cofactor biosynthesis protein B
MHEPSNRKVASSVLTVSDTRSLKDDCSGKIAVEALERNGHNVVAREIVSDEQTAIVATILTWSKDSSIDIIIVTGGTGPSRRDLTPDAILPLMTSTMPGFGELFRQLSYDEIGAVAMFSRAEAGWIDVGHLRTPVFLLPGSPKAVSLAMDKLIVPQIGHLLDVCEQGETQ